MNTVKKLSELAAHLKRVQSIRYAQGNGRRYSYLRCYDAFLFS